MPMALTIMGTGSMTSNMDSVWSPGLMELSMRVTTSMERKRAKGSLLLLMEATTKASSNRMRFAVLESTIGLTENNTKVNGAIIKCTAREP